MSMCDNPLRELSNPGASGSIFYLTNDDEFIIKTVQHKEGEFLQKLLAGYYMNLNQNPRTLLPKFFGLYCYQCNSKNVRLVIMNNLLPSSITLHEKYDLKGSTYKRRVSNPTFRDKTLSNFTFVCFFLSHRHQKRNDRKNRQLTRISISWNAIRAVFLWKRTRTAL